MSCKPFFQLPRFFLGRKEQGKGAAAGRTAAALVLVAGAFWFCCYAPAFKGGADGLFILLLRQ